MTALHRAPHPQITKPQNSAPVPPSRPSRASRSNPAGDPQEPAGLEQRILASALSALASRQHSEEQLRRRLAARFGDVPEIDQSIRLLKDKGYLNDAGFAEGYALNRTTAKPMGRARLARELASKLLPRDVIESAMDQVFQSVPEEELIDRAIERRVRSKGVPGSQAERKKLYDYLARLGFDYDLILRKLRSLKPAAHLDSY